MTIRVCRPTAVLAGVLALTLAPGCSSDKSAQQIAEMNKSNIQRLSNVYAGFQNGMGNRGPKDEAEFKSFIQAYDPAKLSAMGIDPGNLDKLFTSERDGQPFKIRYNVGGGRGSVDPVVFEQAGQNGKKQVGFTGGKVEEVDDAEYAALWSGKKREAAAPADGPPAGAPGGGRPTGSGRPEGAPTGPPGQ